jgi:hypothetical protein
MAGSYGVDHEPIAGTTICRAGSGDGPAGGACFVWGDEHAQQSTVITRATPDQLANAMGRDAFFSDCGASTLLIEGKVALGKHPGRSHDP